MPRTPVSRRQPELLLVPPPVAAPPPAPNECDHAGSAELLHQALGLLDNPTGRVRNAQQLSVRRVLAWLEGYPADTWQDRWLLSTGAGRRA